MTLSTQKTHYDIPQKSYIQGAYNYILARGIPYDDLCDIFEYFSMKEHAGYNMI